MGKVMRLKREAAEFPAPQTREDTIEAIAKIGVLQRNRDRIQAAMNDELAKIRQKYEEEAAPYAESIKHLSQGVQTWCEANKALLTDNGKMKTASLASGEVKWRMRPPSVGIRNIEMVMELLRMKGMSQFIRTKEEINKEAILAEPELVSGIKGITITQKEDFIIIPFETKLEEVA